MIKIIVREEKFPPAMGTYHNTLFLCQDNWDDYSYKTSYNVYFADASGMVVSIGAIKIYNKNMESDYDLQLYDRVRIRNYIPCGIMQPLSNDFCSLGQDLKYYINLKTWLLGDYKEVLSFFRDIATDRDIQKEFLNYRGVLTSLLRDSSALKALQEAPEILGGLNEKHDMSFGYRFYPPYSPSTTEVEFDFKEKGKPFPYRINAIVGKNGTGKTRMLSSLANSISGMRKIGLTVNEEFIGNRPAFYKVMTISFSVFDTFNKPKDNSFCSYIYCGIQKEIRDSDGNKIFRPMEKLEIKDKLVSSINAIKQQGRYNDWKDIIETLIGANEFNSLIKQISDNNRSELLLSSGQNMLILSMTTVIANIEDESILLIDEPETHLHPNAIASFMKMLNSLLETYNSYAIIATHSPLVLQELPSNNITVLERKRENILIAREPRIECFGESISNIIDDTFEVRSNESSFKSILKLAAENMSEQQILDFFKKDLSLNAKVYLNSIMRFSND